MKTFKVFAAFAILGLLLSVNGFSQSGGVVRGFVYDKKTGEPLIGASVYLNDRTKYAAGTDVNGFFTLSKIPAGKYTLYAEVMGYGSVNKQVEIVVGRVINEKIFLEQQLKQLGEAVISGERQEAKTQVQTSVIKITPKQMEKIPSIGGEPDLAQYLQVLPGVIFTGDQGGQLYIRGGAPIQNKVLLDGMIIYNPFHSIGLFSVFDTDIIKQVEVLTGGFGAEYGGRISSIMDITTRDGNKNRMSGKVSASTFMAKLLLEGPLKKAKADSDGSSSFILTAKHSFLEQSSKIFYKYIDSAGLPFNFTDMYGKISLNSKNG
jgi:hypothetical protein